MSYSQQLPNLSWSVIRSKLRVSFVCRACVFVLSIFVSTNLLAAQNVYFGTGSQSGDGIYHSTIDDVNGKLTTPVKVADIAGPGFLAKHPSLDIIYAVAQNKTTPVVVAYKISKDNGLKFINELEIADGGAAHISVHPSGKLLLTAQYGGSSVALFSLNESGALIQREQLIKHKGGSGVVKGRQNNPHPHWVGFSKDGLFAFVPDLGMDTVVIYKVAGNRIQPHSKAETIAGGGPRHMRFSNNGQFIHLLNEFALSITTFSYDTSLGLTHRLNSVATLTDDLKSQEAFNSASEILVHPSGQFVYSANRGHDSISVFKSDESTGALELVENEHVRGAYPRNINMDKKGRWLLAAGQHSNTVSVFAIDHQSGKLQYQTNSIINLPEPICILFVE